MFRYSISLVFVLIFFAGCVSKQATIQEFTEQEINIKKTSYDDKTLNDNANYSEKKLHEDEDFLILQALFAQQNENFKEAALAYKDLHVKTHRSYYLKNAIRLSVAQDDSTLTNDLIDNGLNLYPDDMEILRFHIARLSSQKKFDEAKEIAITLVEKEKSEQNLKLLGVLYLYTQEYNLALKSFESAYAISKSEQSLIHIVDTYIKLNRVNDAISLLETYVRLNGCSIDTCSRLVYIYGKQQNIDGLLNTYKKFYEVFKDYDSAQKIFEIYMYKNKRNEAIGFLEESKHNPELLVDMYGLQKDYQKAIELSKQMYAQSHDINYLAKAAIYTYESEKNKTKILNPVSEKFEIVIKNSTNPVYLNYYGYLLIDHDIDIQKGIDLVQKALEIEPASPHYIDSLAWGLYKQKKCEEALDIIEKIYKNTDESEIKEHYQIIKQCVEEQNR